MQNYSQNKKTAIISGCTGMDGSYLAEFLLTKGYKVIGITNGADPSKWDNIKHIREQIEWWYADVRNPRLIVEAIKAYQPDEYYNLAAQSFVASSWDKLQTTYDSNLYGAINALQAIKEYAPDCRYYQASTSEMFGLVKESPQTEETNFHPRSPYGVSKLAAHWTTINYRESYGLYACCGILYNHESERRHEQFVTRKITKAVARISKGLQDKLELGDITAKRDWGYAPEYVYGMWLMLQQNKPEEYILATGETHSVQEFVEKAFKEVNLNWQDYVVLDKQLHRPAEVPVLQGNATKAKTQLGWEAKTKFNDLIHIMVQHDLSLL